MSDLISRQAAIDAIRTKYCPSDFMDDGVIDAFAEIIQDLPSAQPEQKKGEWIKFTGVNGLFICSHCETIVPVPAFNGSPVWEHCPRCGAKMEAEVEE